jgi:Glycosyltransferase family 87
MKSRVASPIDKTEVLVRLPQPLRVFVGVAFTLTLIAGVVETICRYVLRLGAPYNSPLLHEHFPDLLNLQARFQYFHTLQFFTDTKDEAWMYPAPVAVFYRTFFSFIPHHLGVFISFIVLCFLGSAVLFGRSLIRRRMAPGAAIFLLSFAFITSYPLWFELRQANMEICNWLLLVIGLWSFFRGRGYTAAACFGIAGALKIMPFIYLGLFLAKRQYRHILFALLSAAAVTLPSLWLVYPHVADSWRLTTSAVSKFRGEITLGTMYPQNGFDHSIFGIIKRITFSFLTPQHLSAELTIYSAIALVLFLVLYFGWICKLPFINQVICLCVATLILPPTSFDYTLMSLYLPWALLVLFAVEQGKKGQDAQGLVSAMVCFGILLAPETELIWHHQPLGGQLKALTLVALVFIALRQPFSSELPRKPQTNDQASDLAETPILGSAT